MDWLDLLAVQGTLKSLLQHHRLKASILWHSAFFRAQLSHPQATKVLKKETHTPLHGFGKCYRFLLALIAKYAILNSKA